MTDEGYQLHSNGTLTAEGAEARAEDARRVLDALHPDDPRVAHAAALAQVDATLALVARLRDGATVYGDTSGRI